MAMHYRTSILYRVSQTLGKCLFTLKKEQSANSSLPSSFLPLGKDFAECQKILGKLRIKKIQKTANIFLIRGNNLPNHHHFLTIILPFSSFFELNSRVLHLFSTHRPTIFTIF
jgi:hypothetical protein